jgi:tRNA pseudouridine55 synthase
MASSFHGLLVVDKPRGISSRAAIDRALGWFPRRTRVGHAGTLDPLATGVLVLCVGEATRLTEYVQRMAKRYETSFHLGARSNTDDAEGSITPNPNATAPTKEAVDSALTRFVGEVAQTPPEFSAAKVDGRRAYDLARRGRAVSLSPRMVRIHEILVRTYQYPSLELAIRCGKGTYIRSIARDLGDCLDCGAYVETLRRTRIGPFDVADAIRLDADRTEALAKLLPVGAAARELPRITVADDLIGALTKGQAISTSPFSAGDADGGEVAIFDQSDRLVGIVARDSGDGVFRPKKMLAHRET